MAAYNFLLAFTAFVSLLLAYTAWQRRLAAGAPALTVILLSSAWWLLCYVIPLADMGDADALFLRARLIFPGVVLIPPATLVFALTFTGKAARPTRAQLAALAVEPAIVLSAVAYPGLHDYFYDTWRGRAEDGVFVGGPLYWA
ncbi:MAG: histidine kinase N-terminal 7TM domain-containing protein, partial [Duganella sp.]